MQTPYHISKKNIKLVSLILWKGLGLSAGLIIMLLSVQSVTAQVAPTLTVSSTPLYIHSGHNMVIDPGLTITGTSISAVTGATVTIGNIQSSDQLTFNAALATGYGISGMFSGNQLTLSGNATRLQYEEVLRTISFSAGSASNPGNAQRTMTFTITIQATNLLSFGLYNTGMNADGSGVIEPHGAPVPHWLVDHPGGGVNFVPAVKTNPHTAWAWKDMLPTPNPYTPTARWLGDSNTGVEDAYVYRLPFNIPDRIHTNSIVVRGQWASDNFSNNILVNGVAKNITGETHLAAPG